MCFILTTLLELLSLCKVIHHPDVLWPASDFSNLDLKTGHLCGASPRALFYGQLIGSTMSIFVTTTAYSLYTRVYPIPGPSFPAPTAYVWLGFARLLRKVKFEFHFFG
jgi:hypothetical protein